ncbi:MAG: threonine ammonia-lyase [Sulfolobus sp.]|nr:threonine ammonia-lyase [Sulfolobus sp.]
MNYEELFERISKAKERISKFIHETPLDYSTTFSKIVDGQVYLKLENLQKTGSFKVRGAFNKLMNLSEEERKRGVIAVSAGNHAQGVAYAASILRIRSTIVMPETAPLSKYLATKGYGAEVILYGKYVHESMKKTEELIAERGSVYVHPYDDLDVIAGQGTLGIELLPIQPDIVVVPIGGGGLISGIATALKYKNKNIKVIGVQSTASPSMKISKELGRLVTVEPSYSIADGILVKSPSDLTFEIVENLVDDIVLVDDEEIAYAIMMLLERNKTVAEGAGAASVAALLSGKVKVNRNQKVVALISGGNIDLSLLANIIGKTLYRIKRIVKLQVILPDKPGYLNKILSYLVQIRGNIIDIVHDRMSSDVKPGFSKIIITFEIPQIQDLNILLNQLTIEGFNAKFIE